MSAGQIYHPGNIPTLKERLEMARETTPVRSDRMAALLARFGEEAETFYLNVPGDFVVGIVTAVGTMATKHGKAPYVDFTLVEGTSSQMEDENDETPKPGNPYRLAFLGTVMQGRFDKDLFTPGTRFAAMNRGKKLPRSGDPEGEYNNIDVRILPAE